LRYGSECPQCPRSTPTLHFPRADPRPKPRQAPHERDIKLLWQI
jgi:hypothetical protein